jgi:hypothetical protein
VELARHDLNSFDVVLFGEEGVHVDGNVGPFLNNLGDRGSRRAETRVLPPWQLPF